MAYGFNPFTGNFDDLGPPPLGTSTNPFPITGYYMTDSNGVKWIVTVNTSGVLVTTQVSTVTMVGPWLSLGLTNIQHS